MSAQLDMQVADALNSVSDLANEVDDAEAKRKADARARQLSGLRPIKPGQCLNPRGRPKKDKDLAKIAQKHAEKAIETLVSVMSNEDNPPSARVSAAGEILDRGFGRAPQSLDVNHNVEFSKQFEEFILSIAGRKHESRVIEHQIDDADILDAAE